MATIYHQGPVCPYNNYIDCKKGRTEQCLHCGWNPEVRKERLQAKAKRRMAEDREEYQNRVVDEPLYQVWRQTRNKCHDPDHPGFISYGAKGIRMCQSWRYSLTAFIHDMGPRPDGYVLGRKDLDGPFSPGNCEWMPRGELMRRMNEHKAKARREKQ